MILKILKKDLKVNFSDKRGILLTFLLPIILITLFAFSFGGVGRKKRAPNPTSILVVDKDSSKTSQSFIADLDALSSLKVIATSEENGIERIRKGKNVGVLILGEGFEQAAVNKEKLPLELKYDAAREIQTQMVLAVLRGKLMQTFGKSTAATFYKVNVRTTSVIKKSSNKPNPGLIQAVAGTAIMMLLFSIAAIGGGLLEEKEEGTLKRLLYSPVKPIHILMAKMGTGVVISIIQLTAMFIFAWLAFGLPIFMDTISLVLLILCISFAVSSFGVLLVSTVRSRQQLNGMSTIIIILMSAVGGSMIPITMMPAFIQKAAVISVNYWGIQGFFDVFWRQLSLIEIVPKMLILLAIGIGMILVSIPLFKRNILKLD